MKQLAALLDGFCTAIPELSITGLALDNRQIQTGMAFVALQGSRQHGLAYAQAAVNAGAVVILYEPSIDLTIPILPVPAVAVPQLPKVLGLIAQRFYQVTADDLYVIGITGTDGKTSTTHFIAEALAYLDEQAAVLGTLGVGKPGALAKGTHTTPDAIKVQKQFHDLKLQGFKTVAMEVSSHALDQGRVNGVQFDVAVLTNLTRDHLDYHGTVEAYAEAKRKLFHWPALQHAVLNLDDAFGQRLVAELADTAVLVWGYGVGDASNYPQQAVIATSATFDAQGIQATVSTPVGKGELKAPVLGRFNLHNLLAALSTLLTKGLPLESALAALQHVETVPGRMQRVQVQGKAEGVLVVVDFAHTPTALQQALRAAKAHTAGRLICVFGCGGDRDAGKRPVMAQIAEQEADLVIVTDDNPRTENPSTIFANIRAGFAQPEAIHFEHNRATAIRLAIQQAKSGDTVVIAGKGHETVQILADRSIPFDDRTQATLALQECAA
ncbi:UDP-N-acetylmuramoyl-L-alanyl-D-glutamate--2,6-diaminopimelate ligase [uncultured Thiothrix sp.]|uniref:UDP-N-acetylmuramoyl-L-alanyl-D-glutamate--2, 6-diaminopimelate ligase n=1 Tax=uncultured Thiothrix sp. TaxID=223185 RepID=UPI00261CB0A7|nr:UDP-N-acetylmuramoyl-L-alanyl-D-glutamate--2,6-diaminopimelate ligase [uncultured Thiothrix sp.]HMT91832.1 UDP-N-acetylmuramoyl-L-alanyl-D-glutamate--2,6-diaminopimelate ligase [Thiolinea sp.]